MPDAPAPTYDAHGNLVAEWRISLRYDAVRDLLEVIMSQDAGPYHRAKRVSNTYPVTDLEDALVDIQRAVRIMGARRLF